MCHFFYIRILLLSWLFGVQTTILPVFFVCTSKLFLLNILRILLYSMFIVCVIFSFFHRALPARFFFDPLHVMCLVLDTHGDHGLPRLYL